MSIFWIICGFFACCTAVTLLLFETADEGYEDENGFHLGKQPVKND